ncbi:MAG: Flp family type IVb pilin [Chloroflexi bacterium]|nr:Flp family type IVb pilin [Chloroflexota bacterium]
MNTVSTMNDKMNTLALQLVLLVKSYLPTNERQEGQGMVEYALIIALIAVLLVGGLAALEGKLDSTFTAIKTALGS